MLCQTPPSLVASVDTQMMASRNLVAALRLVQVEDTEESGAQSLGPLSSLPAAGQALPPAWQMSTPDALI